MTPPALRGTLSRAHFRLEDRLSQPDGLFEGFPAVHAEHYDEQVPCAIVLSSVDLSKSMHVANARSRSVRITNVDILSVGLNKSTFT